MKKGVPVKSKTVPKNIMAAFISRQNLQVLNIVFFVNVIMLAIFSKIKYFKIKTTGRRLSYRSGNWKTSATVTAPLYSEIAKNRKGEYKIELTDPSLLT